MMQWTKEWNQEYTSNAKTYISIPTIDLKLWTNSYKWWRLNKVLIRCTDETNGLFYFDVTSGLSTSKPVESIPTQWDTFHNYKTTNFSQYRVYIDENWRKETCNCPAFVKCYMCKHVIGVAKRLNYTDVPIQAKALPIERKRKPGRPTKTKKALERQWFFYVLF